MVYTDTEDGEKALCFGGSEESYLIGQDENGRDLTVQIVLIDNLDGSVVDVERFSEALKVDK